jgi:hypothetical protein
MSSQYYKITRRLGTPHRNSVTVTIPLVGPVGPVGPQGPQGLPGEVSGSIAWDNVSEKPTTFPPSSHTHTADQITDFTAAVEAVSPPADWDTLANRPSTFPPSSHGHVAADVSDFSTAAAAAAPVQSVAGRTGAVTLAKADVGLSNVDNTSDLAKPISTATQSALDGKAATSHTHPSSAITDFTTAAAAAAPVASVAGRTGAISLAVADVSGAVADTDARLSDSRTPTSHASSHFSAGADPIAPSDIGAQSIFVTEDLGTITANVQLTAARAKIYTVTVNTFDTPTPSVQLPSTGVQAGDVVEIRFTSFTGREMPVRNGDDNFLGASLKNGQKATYIAASTSNNSWTEQTIARHAHGNITNEGAIGTTSGLPIRTGGSGVLQAGAFGTGAGDFCEGNDSRFSDIPDPSTATPQPLGSASAGTSDDYSRGDHIHAAPALNDLSNVSAATPSDNDVLTFDAATSTWVAEAPSGGGGASLMQSIAVGFVLN